MIDWASLFDEQYPKPGALVEELARAIEQLSSPLSASEIEVIKHNGHMEPAGWIMPQFPLPPSYLDFLQWSNGGAFRTGDRWFDDFLSIQELRDYLLAYHIPAYMSGALPFAFDGGGGFYLFDIRAPSASEEYRVVWSHAGALGWDMMKVVGHTFLWTSQINVT